MADNSKDKDARNPASAIGMLDAVTENLQSSTSPAVAPTTSVTPVTFAGKNIPNGRISVEAEDPSLAKKFVGDNMEVETKPREDKGMDLATLMILMGENRDLNDVSDEEYASSFKDLIDGLSKVPGFENIKNEKVTFGGRTMTLGELSESFDSNGFGPAMFSQARLLPGSGVSKAAIGTAEQLAARRGVLDDIQRACQMTGADYGAMLAIAKQESGFNPNARAKTSSATGLYQFLDSTWEATVRKHGDTLRRAGIDPATASRTNPLANALMGAEFYKDNERSLERALGRDVGAGEVYMAHFLGEGGAKKFFRALEQNPNAMASSLFPQAARSNNIMHGKTLAEFGQTMAGKVGSSLNFELT